MCVFARVRVCSVGVGLRGGSHAELLPTPQAVGSIATVGVPSAQRSVSENERALL